MKSFLGLLCVAGLTLSSALVGRVSGSPAGPPTPSAEVVTATCPSGVSVYKFLIFIKRRAGMTPEAFRDYYENRHAKIGNRVSPGLGACYYVRRYLKSATRDEFDYDEITEVWFTDRAKFASVVAKVSRGDLPPGAKEDGERFMDRSKSRFVTVEEVASQF